MNRDVNLTKRVQTSKLPALAWNRIAPLSGDIGSGRKFLMTVSTGECPLLVTNWNDVLGK